MPSTKSDHRADILENSKTDGGDSGVDTYAFNILKTGNATYDMIANQVKGS